MKLPEEFKNWIEFAKKCDEILRGYPNAQTVKNSVGPEPDARLFAEEYNINAVKAKAFDEVMELKTFSMDDVMILRETAYRSAFAVGKGEFIFNLLVKLCQK